MQRQPRYGLAIFAAVVLKNFFRVILIVSSREVKVRERFAGRQRRHPGRRGGAIASLSDRGVLLLDFCQGLQQGWQVCEADGFNGYGFLVFVVGRECDRDVVTVDLVRDGLPCGLGVECGFVSLLHVRLLDLVNESTL